MMINIYCPKDWPSVQLLVNEIQQLGQECRHVHTVPVANGINPLLPTVSWGYGWSEALNGDRHQHTKLDELIKLRSSGLLVPDHVQSLAHIPAPPWPPPADWQWLGRTNKHSGGKDLVRWLRRARISDFYVKKLDLVKEFRVHIFDGKSIRMGLKVPRVNVTPHPWIRSFRQGWNIDYGTACQEARIRGLRKAAKRAVKALGYAFGAVDIGITADNKIYVLEVNTAPGLQNKATAQAYARHIVAWFAAGQNDAT